MKIGLFSDLHMDYKGFEISGIDALNKTFDVFKKEKVKGIIFLGDFFSKRYKIPHRLLYTVVQEIEKFEYLNELDFFYMLPGNHDMFLLSGANSISFLNLQEKIKVFEKPEKIKIDKINCYFFPYRKKFSEEDLKFLKSPKSGDNILFVHQYLDVKEESIIETQEDILDEKILSKYDLVFSGHYHAPFVRENKKYKLFNLGSNRHISFKDCEGRDRYVYVWDTKKSAIKEFSLDVAKYIKLTISDEKERDSVMKEIKKNNKDFYKLKIPVELITSDLELLPNVETSKEYDKFEVESRIGISEDCSIEEIFERYVKNLIEDKKEASLYIERGLELMKEVGINV